MDGSNAELIPVLGAEAELVRVPDGGGVGDGDGAGRRDLTTKIMEEQVKSIQRTIKTMTKEIVKLKTENKALENNNWQHQHQDKKGK